MARPFTNDPISVINSITIQRNAESLHLLFQLQNKYEMYTYNTYTP